MFDDDTQKRMLERKMGASNPYNVPNDELRHQGAASRIKNDPFIKVRGYAGSSSEEPIICIRWKSGRYGLIEGWHRTIQNLLAKPEGYRQKAYVLIGKK